MGLPHHFGRSHSARVVSDADSSANPNGVPMVKGDELGWHPTHQEPENL